jgi:hypothetical protein
MWCLETIKQINQHQAEGLNAYEAYTASGIRVLGDSAKISDKEEVPKDLNSDRTRCGA